MSIVICALISVLTAWFLLKPVFSDSAFVEQSGDAAKIALLLDQKERSVNMLRDLELDYSTGKLSDDEYGNIKTELSYELAGVIEKIDKN